MNTVTLEMLSVRQKKHAERIERMKDYLLLKFEERDWHGCEDAASDIRDLESKIEELEYLKEFT